MRSFYSIRSNPFGILTGIGSLAVVAGLMSFFLMQIPASAAEVMPIGKSYVMKFEQPLDLSVIVFDVLPAAEVEQLADRAGAASVIAFALLHPLKREYAESYQTHGLNFIETRWRC
ncbi:hypothetical protein J2W92_002327 [Rhizobium leguminosarum]